MFTRTSGPLDDMNSLLGFSLFSSVPGILLLYCALMEPIPFQVRALWF